jgi:hypothetical protein
LVQFLDTPNGKQLSIDDDYCWLKKARDEVLQMEDNLRKFDEDKQKELETILNEQKLLEKHEKNKKLNEWKVGIK